MRRLALVLVVVAACGGGSSATKTTLPPTTSFDSKAPTTLDSGSPPPTAPASQRPAFFHDDATVIGYVLDNGLVMWVDPPIGHIFAGDGQCDHLIGDGLSFYKRYNHDTVPGFQGVVCHPESLATPN